MGIDQETIDKLREEHGPGKLFLLPDPDDEGDEIIVRLPTRPEWARFTTQLQDEKRMAKAQEQLVRDCLVHPSKDDLEAIFNRRPGLASSWGLVISQKAGAARSVEAKKL